MKQAIGSISFALQGLWGMYRPVRAHPHIENITYMVSSLIFLPRVFLWPVLYFLGRLILKPSLERLSGFLFTVFHLALLPLMIPYFIALPLLGCRMWIHTPAGRALTDIMHRVQAQREADAG